MLWDHGDSNPWENPMPNQKEDSCLQKDQEPLATCNFLSHGKFMLWINKFFIHLVETTLYQK